MVGLTKAKPKGRNYLAGEGSLLAGNSHPPSGQSEEERDSKAAEGAREHEGDEDGLLEDGSKFETGG